LRIIPGSKKGDFGIFVVRAWNSRLGEPFKQCPNCTRITFGATAHSGIRPFGRELKLFGFRFEF
jgi:hypothetical protein